MPAGYIPAEFLEFKQLSCIRTDYLPERGHSFKVKVLFPELPESAVWVIGGIYYNRYNIIALHGKWCAFTYYAEQYMTSPAASSEWSIEANKKYTYELNDIEKKSSATPNDSIVFEGKKNGYWAGHSSPNGEFSETFRIGAVKEMLKKESSVRHFAWTFMNPQKEVVLELYPAFDYKKGECLLYDSKRKKSFYQENKEDGYIVPGFTLAQARQLSKLPAGGGTLTISLPTGYESDAGVANALETARGKGWTLTIQTYTPENATAGASTFALRRIWVRKTQDDNGTYVDADGSRWVVDWCVDMLTPDGSTPDAHGYELFRSVDAAVAYWELEPWVDPEAEIFLTNQEQ